MIENGKIKLLDSRKSIADKVVYELSDDKLSGFKAYLDDSEMIIIKRTTEEINGELVVRDIVVDQGYNWEHMIVEEI